jgi:6-phosphogluconolactonase
VIELTVTEDADAAARACAERVAAAIAAARAERGVAHVALCGGETPGRMYRLLPGLVEDWRDVHLWLGDERCVPLDDEDSNHLLLTRTLLDRIPSDRPQPMLHAVTRAGDGDPPAAAAAYERALRDQVPGETTWGPASAGHVAGSATPPVPVLDLALQGIGPDGHTASLFPDDPALEERERLVVAVHRRKPPPDGVTMTLPVLRAARSLVLLVAGAGKADAVRATLAGPSRHTPASLLGDGATVELIADRAAAAAA